MVSAITTVFGSATPLQTCRNVWRLADNRMLLSRTRSDQVADNDQPRGNADTRLQWGTRLQRSHRFDQFQPRPHRPLSVVLVGLWIAEVHEHAVTHVLWHEPAKPPTVPATHF